jgi:hypothetical protein
MQSAVFFDNIRIEAPREQIYRRLGYRKGRTRTSAAEDAEVEASIAGAYALIGLKGAALRLPILGRDAARIVLAGKNGEVVWESRRLAKLLEHCGEVLLMGATAGGRIMEAIREDMDGNRVTRGVVLDAAASETVDAALDWIMGYFRQGLRRENKTLTGKRFSAGYGDFLLENQRGIAELLDLGRIGVELTAGCILTPEKSVTAVAGIREI